MINVKGILAERDLLVDNGGSISSEKILQCVRDAVCVHSIPPGITVVLKPFNAWHRIDKPPVTLQCFGK